jgi:hypothetical protein
MPAVESKKRNSILGSLALLLATPAIGLNYFDFPGLPNVQMGPFNLRFGMAVAVSVMGLAFLSLLLASRSRRTGTEIPLAAVLVSGAALGLGYFRHRTPPPAPTTAPAVGTVAVPPAPTETKPSPAKPAAAQKPVAKLPNASKIAGQARNTANTATDAAIRQRNLALLRQAESDYDTARAAVMKALETDPVYAAAKADSDSTMTELRQARIDNRPGSPALVTASQKALAARDKLQVIIDNALSKDPDTARAKDQLDSVKASMQRPGGAKP